MTTSFVRETLIVSLTSVTINHHKDLLSWERAGSDRKTPLPLGLFFWFVLLFTNSKYLVLETLQDAEGSFPRELWFGKGGRY